MEPPPPVDLDLDTYKAPLPAPPPAPLPAESVPLTQPEAELLQLSQYGPASMYAQQPSIYTPAQPSMYNPTCMYTASLESLLLGSQAMAIRLRVGESVANLPEVV